MSFISYAQNFEDVILWRALKHLSEGFYIDVGANDPSIDSVTKAFYERGWHGINIEPLTSHAAELRAQRERDINLQCAAGAESGEILIWDSGVRGWATASREVIDQHVARGHEGIFHKVSVRRLAEICEEFVTGEIHFLKIDVEGFEEPVLQGMDFSLFRPWILVIEAANPNSTSMAHDEWEGMVLSAEYTLAYCDGLNRFYVANEHPELLNSFCYPPNVFDRFIRSEHFSSELRAQQAEARAAQAEARAAQAEARAAQAEARNIAVDLTPVLPGGENGGAKIFVLELLRRLADTAPNTQFVLLTHAASHEELATMDRPNMRRLMVVGPVIANSLRIRLMGFAARFLPHLPARLRGIVSRMGYKLNTLMKRGGSGSLLRDMGVDLLFCPFTATTYFEPGIPTVCTIYDLQYKTYPEFFAVEDVAHRERTFIEACRRATAFAAISDYSRDSAVSHGGLDLARIRTIHLCMAQQRITPRAEHDKDILDRLSVVSQRYLVYPANFWKHKNHEMLLTAFGMACHEGLPADIKLVCTGVPGGRQTSLMSAARTMNLDDRILFPGYLPNPELASLMADCVGVVFPSLYEGFGLPVIEAMAASVPVACSNTTSLPEVAADAALLFDPRIPTQIAQAMISLVNNETLRARLIQDGLRRAAEFSDPVRMAREYLQLFSYALANRRHENLLNGVYSDGWVGPSLHFQVAPANCAQTIEIKLLAPEWLPRSPLTVIAKRSGKNKGFTIVLERGKSVVIPLSVQSIGGNYEVSMSPTFVPARTGYGDDQRELSVTLERCRIVGADGECVELFPEKALA